MSNIYDCIPPDKDALVLLSICAMISGALILLGYEGAPPLNASPYLLLCISIIGLYQSTRTVVFSKKAIQIKYILFHRTIDWHRVKGIEFVPQQHNYYIFICLGNCPFWSETTMKLRPYIVLHPTKLVAIRIAKEQSDVYMEKLKEYCCNVHMTHRIVDDIIS